MKTVTRIMIAALSVLMAVPALGQSSGRISDTIVLGEEITPRDSSKNSRFTNRLISPKGDWQCGLAVMYADFNSANADYMLILQGLNAKASFLRIAPEATYTFKDNHAFGARFTYTKAGGMLDSATLDLLGNMSLTAGELDASTNTMGASIFKRTYLGIDKQGRFGIFWDYVLGISRSRTQLASPAYSVKDKISFAFAPGVIYFPMNNISVHANISIADLSYATTTAYEESGIVGTHKGWRAQAGLNLLNLNFGLTIHL
jgi:hypothetical protein